jgi:hypothetical protein
MLDSPGCMWFSDDTYELVNTPVEFAAILKEKLGHDAAKYAQQLIDEADENSELIKDTRRVLENLKYHIDNPCNKITRTYVIKNLNDIIERLEA